MLDDPGKTEALMAGLKKLLPIQSSITPDHARVLSKRTPAVPIPSRCHVVDVIYSGDLGGILCCTDIGGSDTKTPHIVSLTNLSFNRNAPLAREIEAYQRHRIKKLKRQQGRFS